MFALIPERIATSIHIGAENNLSLESYGITLAINKKTKKQKKL